MTTFHRLGLGIALGALVVLSSGATGAWAATPPPFEPRHLGGADKSTIQKLHDGNQLEMQMGKLAQDKGSTRAVRDFGKTLVADHLAADRRLDEHLRKRGLDLTALASTTNADPEHEMLATKTGVDFDRSFAQQLIRDHQKVLDLLDSARVETADDSLRLLYDQLTITVRAHKRAAEDILVVSARS
jgi:putative membrane protein